jgi:hypothetical protein
VWERKLAAGEAVLCARGTDCKRGGVIRPGDEWDLGHRDGGRGYAGPEHAHCNRSAGGKARAAQLYGPKRSGAYPGWSRHWIGPYNTLCPVCRELGYGCPAADPE